MPSDVQHIITKLDQLLEQERTCLLTGDVASFPDLLQRKEALLNQLSEVERSRLPNLDQLQMRFKLNQTLFESAMRGIQATTERLKALGEVRDSLDIYDQHGQRQKHTTRSSVDFEKRA